MSDASCSIARALGVIGDWWSLLIVRDALNGLRRFSEFQTHLGLAKNILSARLKKLVDLGILEIVPDPDGSRHNAYVPTKRGEGLGVVLVSLWQWGEDNCFADRELRSAIVDRRHGEPLARLKLTTTSGREVGPGDYTTAPIEARR
jgi:DNA-binding HxlR family transcriptional regulator